MSPLVCMLYCTSLVSPFFSSAVCISVAGRQQRLHLDIFRWTRLVARFVSVCSLLLHAGEFFSGWHGNHIERCMMGTTLECSKDYCGYAHFDIGPKVCRVNDMTVTMTVTVTMLVTQWQCWLVAVTMKWQWRHHAALFILSLLGHYELWLQAETLAKRSAKSFLTQRNSTQCNHVADTWQQHVYACS